MKLSPHFTLEEATFSETAARFNIPNQPTAKQLENMIKCAEYFEKVRVGLDAPIKINSWLRLPALNVAIGGSPTSAHKDGWAIDSVCSKYDSVYDYGKAMLTF